MSKTPIYVTQPTLPPLDEFIPYLNKIWDSKILSNNGPMHQRLEKELAEYLGVKYIALFNNGTNALLTALQALEIKGEVITTPYSFIATANTILWNNLTPVFVDINESSLNIDPAKIELAITENTTAIMPVHCYGNSCDVTAIQNIADKHDLKILYDAAHAFAVKDAGGSILRHGDLSVLSFHATKVFNTFEGGAIICHDEGMKARIDKLKNFGIEDEVTITEAGLNGKMSEVNAAFGLLQLNYIDEALRKRKDVDSVYCEKLSSIKGIHVVSKTQGLESNYSYFPILVGSEYPLTRDELYEKLKAQGVFARRYFYPLLSEATPFTEFPSSNASNLKIAVETSNNVLCLPIYPDLSLVDVEKIIGVIA
jgi:dTDP-4-amino-4,6-dideoxygalactose transaminase